MVYIEVFDRILEVLFAYFNYLYQCLVCIALYSNLSMDFWLCSFNINILDDNDLDLCICFHYVIFFEYSKIPSTTKLCRNIKYESFPVQQVLHSNHNLASNYLNRSYWSESKLNVLQRTVDKRKPRQNIFNRWRLSHFTGVIRNSIYFARTNGFKV